MSKNNNNILLYNKEKVLDIISCSICLDKFKHPRNLDCGHTFCTTCLHMIKINDEIVCPLCRKITTLNSNKLLVDLPLNNILISIIDETAITSKMDINSNNDKLKLKKSKSVDSFVHFKKKNKDERKILYTNHLKIMTNDLNTEIENNDINEDCNRECCTFQ